MHSRLPIAVTLLLAICGAVRAAEHTKDSLDKVKSNLAEKKAVLIDVRELGEWKQGHLRDAQLVPLSELNRAAKDESARGKIEKALPKERIIYCHCRSGVRVLRAAEILKPLGYDIRPLAAGYEELLEAGFPAAPPEKP